MLRATLSSELLYVVLLFGFSLVHSPDNNKIPFIDMHRVRTSCYTSISDNVISLRVKSKINQVIISCSTLHCYLCEAL